MFRKRNAHADAHSLMSELLDTIHECMASAEGGAAQINERAKSGETAVALRQPEQGPAQTRAQPESHDDVQ
jgi:hypothetical protein